MQDYLQRYLSIEYCEVHKNLRVGSPVFTKNTFRILRKKGESDHYNSLPDISTLDYTHVANNTARD